MHELIAELDIILIKYIHEHCSQYVNNYGYLFIYRTQYS